jgi:hypothetical protein
MMKDLRYGTARVTATRPDGCIFSTHSSFP